MRTVAIISDIHANESALEIVYDILTDKLSSGEIQGIWCLGDLIGRGTAPFSTLILLKRLYDKLSEEDQAMWLAGNHDWLVLNKISAGLFREGGNEGGLTQAAVDVAMGHREIVCHHAQLRNWLDKLPVATVCNDHIYAAHGRYEVLEDGTLNEKVAVSSYGFAPVQQAKLPALKASLPVDKQPHLLLVGHTHYYGAWQLHKNGGNRLTFESVNIQVDETVTFTNLDTMPVLLNPGSVGFPREEPYCPSYMEMTYNREVTEIAVTLRHFAYDWRHNDIPSGYPDKFLEEMQNTESCNC